MPEQSVSEPRRVTPPETSDPNVPLNEPPSPWREPLKQMGIPLDIPAQFTDREQMPPRTNFDPLTSLPIDNDGMRLQIAGEFSQAVRDNSSFVVLYRDVDNLKVANTKHGRQFGNIVIEYGAASLLQTIQALNLPEDVRMHATRQTGAADETALWLFNVTQEQIDEIKRFVLAENDPIQTHDPEFSFSSSTAILTSNDEKAQEVLNNARKSLSENPDQPAFREFNDLKDLADNDVKLLKISKDLQRLPVWKLASANGEEEIRRVILEDLGNSRISELLLSRVYEIAQFETHLRWRDRFPSVEQFKLHLSYMEINPWMIEELCSHNPRERYFERITRSSVSNTQP
ncbi:MAG TPA: diguanylate cyclase [Patescibacteria group bacterium]|nr:diguanylate cyclase [Patescibacteria group bacterium]